MPRVSPILRLFIPAMLVLPATAQTVPNQNLFPGVTATAGGPFPGVAAEPQRGKPLGAAPTVIALDHLGPAQMSDADNQVVANLSAELSRQAALANFDISNPEWHYQQIQCPAFPDYVFLSFHHGPEGEGSSHFVAMLPRANAEVRLVSTYAHGLLPFEASWDRPSSFEVFNGMLRRERGPEPLSYAPNWLMIAVCYAELSGYPVQVLAAAARPEPTLDLLRLDANQPQMRIGSDQSAEVTFSDVSRPGLTSNWQLHFDRRGQLTHAAQALNRQPAAIALKP